VPKKRRLTRDESKAKTRADLLRAARRLFLRNGFVATSLSQIAEEAALTKGAVYSNFANKEELFLALLQGGDEGRWTGQEELAPSDLSVAKGRTPAERARAWGRHVAGIHPSRRHMALFLEMNAFALRNDREREYVAKHNAEFFKTMGAEMAGVLDAPDADHELLGLVAQSLYAGLQMHQSFEPGGADPEVFAKAYELLAYLAKPPR
jgi:AcrR family transcriptional regulator